MAVMISPSVMRLGVIERDGKLYMAYLHYRDDKGEKNITELMRQAQKGLAEYWEKAASTLHGRVERCEFFESGYKTHGSEIITPYDEEQTQKAVGDFFKALKEPQAIIPMGSSISYAELDFTNEDAKRLATSALAKVRHHKLENLNDEEFNFLEALHYEVLTKGDPSATDYSKSYNELRRIAKFGLISDE